jgi:hypothetical protein
LKLPDAIKSIAAEEFLRFSLSTPSNLISIHVREFFSFSRLLIGVICHIFSLRVSIERGFTRIPIDGSEIDFD